MEGKKLLQVTQLISKVFQLVLWSRLGKMEHLTHTGTFAIAVSTIVTVAVIRLSQCLPLYRTGRRRNNASTTAPIPTLVFWGSGGHTTEMIRLICQLNSSNYQPFYFVLSHSDTTSKDKILAAKLPFQHLATWISISRGREVKQSWLSTVFTSLQSLMECLWLIWKLRPGMIVCNGPGTCVLICYAAFFLRLLGICQPILVFVESFCRVSSLSLSGKLIYPIADKFIVQWPQLTDNDRYSRAEYLGRIC